MDQEKAIKTLDKILKENTKITSETELDHWFGQTPNGDKCQITEISMMEIIECGFCDKELLQKAMTEDFITLPDGAKFGKTIKALRENGLAEIAGELKFFALQQNLQNGFADPDPDNFIPNEETE